MKKRTTFSKKEVHLYHTILLVFNRKAVGDYRKNVFYITHLDKLNLVGKIITKIMGRQL